MKTIVITGATGFIGRALVKELLKKNFKLRILSRKAVKSENPNIEYIKTDYENISELETALDGAEGVFHIAGAITAPSYSDFYKANVKVTANLVSASVKTKPEFFIYTSTLAAGGPSISAGKPRNEEMKDCPVSQYGKTKLLGEKELYRLPKETRYITLRPPIVYGANDSGVYQIISWIKRGVMINPSKSDVFFSFIYIDDLIESMFAIVENKEIKNKTYYICEDKFHSWYGFIKEAAKAVNTPMPKMIYMPAKIFKLFVGVTYFLARIFGKTPMLSPDKAKEFNAGNWIAVPSNWMHDSNQTVWTSLEEGLKKSYR